MPIASVAGFCGMDGAAAPKRSSRGSPSAVGSSEVTTNVRESPSPLLRSMVAAMDRVRGSTKATSGCAASLARYSGV